MGSTGSRQSFVARHRPSILVIASQISAVALHGIVKVLETGPQPVHPFQILHIRLLITGVGCMLYLWSRGVSDFPLGPRNARRLLLLRALGGVCGAIGFYCTKYSALGLGLCSQGGPADSILVSILYLTLAQATALNFLAPLGAMVLARYLDYGTFGYLERVGGLVALAGVMLVVQPNTFSRDDESSTGVANETAPQRLEAVSCGMIGVLGGIVSRTGDHGAIVYSLMKH